MSFFSKLFKPKANPFFEEFKEMANKRGVVCYFQQATKTRVNDVGIVEKFAIVPETTKLILLPGDPYELVNADNLVAFEPLNRSRRLALIDERRKLTGETQGMKFSKCISTIGSLRNLKELRKSKK